MTGFGTLLRLALRRDRWLAPLWIVVFVANAAGSAAATIDLSPDGFADLPGVRGLTEEQTGDGLRLRFQVATADLDKVMQALAVAGITSLASRPPTLEELFLRLYEADA